MDLPRSLAMGLFSLGVTTLILGAMVLKSAVTTRPGGDAGTASTHAQHGARGSHSDPPKHGEREEPTNRLTGSEHRLADDEVFVRVGNTVETIRRADAIAFDRQTMSGDGDDIPLLVFVGDESYRNRLGDPQKAIGIELMGTDRWTIGFLDQTADRYIALIDVDTVEKFFEMVREVETLRFDLSFPESPEAKQCPDCRGTDHVNHVIDIDTDGGEAFVDEVRGIVGTEIYDRPYQTVV